MAEENSSLRTAINKIMGWPAGGEGGGTVKTAAPPATSIALANNVAALAPDPMIAQLESLKASNADLSTQIAGMTTPTTPTTTPTATETTPTVAEPAAEVPANEKYTISLQDYQNYINDFNKMEWAAAGASTDRWPDYVDWGKSGQSYYVDPLTGNSMNLETGAKGAKYMAADYNSAIDWVPPTPGNLTVSAPAAATGAAAAPAKAPVNPGPRAPWQQSQQYWKDLAAFTGK